MRFKGPIITPDGPLIAGVRVTDDTHNFTSATSLTFNPMYFYLSNDSQGKPMVNLGGRKNVLVRVNSDLGLTSGAALATTAFTTAPGGYDYGGWFSAGNAFVTVPTGVTLVTISAHVVYTPTGACGAGSFCTTHFLNNSNPITPTGFKSLYSFSTASGISATSEMLGGPFKVKPGDQLSLGFQATWITASAMTVTASSTFFSVQAINL